MLATIVGCLLPIVVTLLLGYIAGWHRDFDANQATVLNRMVMLYALPMLLFAGMVSITRDQLTADVPLAAALLIGILGTFIAAVAIVYFLCGRDLSLSALRAMAITSPAVPFVGIPVLGYLFGPHSTIPVVFSALVINGMQTPLCMVLLSIGAAKKGAAAAPKSIRSVFAPIISALREPVIWAPLSALIVVLVGIRIPVPIRHSLGLLGNATGGVALFASGVILYTRRMSLNIPVVVSTFVRNIVIPGGIWAAAVMLGLPLEVRQTAVLTLAIPTGSICVILAVQYQTAEQEMASTLFLSTISSVVTLGGFIWLTGAQ
ncbi:MAG TPA: AEC family transporter [Phycisphaerae bacterium]|nr:AEC family transporter [Phycisphaerae bacterium]